MKTPAANHNNAISDNFTEQIYYLNRSFCFRLIHLIHRGALLVGAVSVVDEGVLQQAVDAVIVCRRVAVRDERQEEGEAERERNVLDDPPDPVCLDHAPVGVVDQRLRRQMVEVLRVQ